MKLLFKLIFLLWTSHANLINGQNTISNWGMQKLNAECFPENSCLHRSLEASHGVMTSTGCSCDRLCSQLGTCCKDSPYIGIPSPAIRPHCKNVHSPFNSAYFMIDRCPSGDNISVEWHRLCGDDWNGEDIILKFAPVTSLSTSITYKNYFCFKCHEMGDDVFYWDIHLLKESDISDINKQPNFTMRAEFETETAAGESSRIKLEYSTEKKSWMAAVGKDNNAISVVLEIKVPKEIRSLVIGCDPNVISNCSTTWNDVNVRDKCDTYTAVIYIAKEDRFLKYKNAYCALCNFESLDDMYCMNSSASVLGYASEGYRIRNVEHAGDSETYGGSGQHAQEGGGHRSDGSYGASGEYRAGGGGYVARSGGYSTRNVPGEGWYGPRGGENKRNGADETNRRYAGTNTGGYEGRTSTMNDERSEGARRGGYGGGGDSVGYGRETRPGYGEGESSGYGGGAVSRHRGGYRQGGSAGYGGAAGGVYAGGGSAGYGGAAGGVYAGGGSAGYGGGYERGGSAGYGGVTGGGYGEGVGAGYGGGYRRGGSAGYGVATGGYRGHGGGHGVGVGGYGREYSRGYWETTVGGYGGPYPTPPYPAVAGYQGGYVRRSSAAFGGAANVGQRRATGRRKRYFSLVDILHVNKFKEKSPRKTQKCDKNFLWDPYSKTCLELICDNPALELKEGQCV